MYNSMHKQQELDQSLSKEDRQGPGLHEQVMKDYLDATGMNQRMAKQNLDVRNIDNDGDGTRNHYFFRIGPTGDQKNATVYDPYARKGGQVVTEADQVSDYQKTNWATLHYQDQ
jgi:hypothetical protein